MSLTSQAVSGVKWNGLAVAIRICVQFISMAVLARLLAPEDFGLQSMALFVTGFAHTFAGLGLGNAIIHKQDASREQLSSIYWLNIVMGFSLLGLLWIVAPLVASYFQESALVPILRWSALSFPVLAIGQQFQSLLRRDLRFRATSMIGIVASIGYVVSATGFAYAGFGVMSLVWAALLQSLIGTILMITTAIRSRWLPTLHFRYSDLKGYVGFGFFQMGEQSINYLASNVDYLIIGRFLGAETLGYYTLAYNLMRVPLVYINPVIVSVAFPAFARIQNRDDLLRQGYSKILQYLSAITFPLMAGMFVVAPLIVPLLFGEQWKPSVPIVQVFALLGVFKSLGNPLGSILLAKGRADLAFYLNLIVLLGYSVVNLVAVRWGAIGVAASSLLFVMIVLTPLDFYLRWRTINMTAMQYWLAIRTPLFSTLSMLLFLGVLQWFVAPVNQGVAVLLVFIVFGATIYSAVIWLLDRPLINEVWGHLKITPPRRI